MFPHFVLLKPMVDPTHEHYIFCVIYRYVICSSLVVTLEIIPRAATSILLKPVVVPTQSIAPVDTVAPSYKA